jgi:hypothetical protein
MTPKQLAEVGEALYGPHWQSFLARDLGIDPRSMRRYVAGDRQVPPEMPAQLRELLAGKRKALDRAERLLQR